MTPLPPDHQLERAFGRVLLLFLVNFWSLRSCCARYTVIYQSLPVCWVTLQYPCQPDHITPSLV